MRSRDCAPPVECCAETGRPESAHPHPPTSAIVGCAASGMPIRTDDRRTHTHIPDSHLEEKRSSAHSTLLVPEAALELLAVLELAQLVAGDELHDEHLTHLPRAARGGGEVEEGGGMACGSPSAHAHTSLIYRSFEVRSAGSIVITSVKPHPYTT